jgi:serine protease Do
VANVDENSNSAEAGLEPNDLILEINRQPVPDADGAIKLCEKAKGDQIFLKVWRRNGQASGTRFLSVDNTKQDVPAK